MTQPGMFADTIRLEFSQSELERLRKQSHLSEGGWGHLLTDILRRLDGQAVELTDTELQRVDRYAESGGSGGWQSSFRLIRSASWRAGWKPPA